MLFLLCKTLIDKKSLFPIFVINFIYKSLVHYLNFNKLI